MKFYIMKQDLYSYDGSVKIEKGKLVTANKYEISTLNHKTVIRNANEQHLQIPQYINGTSYGWAKYTLENYTRVCKKLSCNDDEILIMNFITGGWHDFYAIGNNPHEMYKKLIKLFNHAEGTNYNTRTIKSYEFFDDFQIKVSKVSINNLCYARERDTDDKYFNKEAVYIGNYMGLYSDKIWDYKHNFFKTTMI